MDKLKINQLNQYKNWLQDLKQNFQKSQIKAHIQVNKTLLAFYWQLGKDIIQKQKEFEWGSGFLQQLSSDLTAEFPTVKGFSYSNLRKIRRWVEFWEQLVPKLENEKGKQLVPKLENEKGKQLVSQLENEKRQQLVGKSKNDLIVEYALKNINKPLGVSKYELTEILPKDYRSSLPTIEQIEKELNNT